MGAMLQLAERGEQSDIASLYLPVEDGEPLPALALSGGVGFVRSQKAAGRRVLIACGAGLSRSPTFAMAVLKEEENLDLLEAVRQVRARHPEALPHPVLWESLCRYYGEDIPLTQFLEALRG